MTVAQQLEETSHKSRSLSWGASLLVLGKGFQMGAGFLFWAVAARAASVDDVGVVAAAVSAVMLCTQIGLLGAGAAAIVAIGRGEQPSRVLDVTTTTVSLASLLVALCYVGVTAWSGGTVAAAQSSPLFVAAFVVGSVTGTVLILFDQAGIALGREHGSILRYFLGGAAALGVAATVALRADEVGAAVVFACWTLASVVVCAVGLLQLRRWIGYRLRPAVALGEVRRNLAVGLPNHLLTLTERLPALLVPVLVAHLVSPSATAYWYPAWMLAWVAYTVPVQVGLMQFSEGVRRPDQIARTARSGLVWGVVMGGAAAILLAVLADPLLRVIGADYARSSADALRVLALGALPFAVWQAYNALCRSRGLLLEGVVAGLLLAVLICTTTLLAAPHGSTALAQAWVATTAAGSIWAAFRVYQAGVRA